MESTKFIILTLGRTGSNYLCSLYSKHPQIQMDGELFNERELAKKFNPFLMWLIRTWPFFYLRYRNKKALRRKKSVYGFKLLLPQWPYDINQGISELVQKGYKPIYLFRRNMVAQLISIAIANQEKRWVVRNVNEYSNEKKSIDLELAKEKLALLDIHEKQLNAVCDAYPGLILYYEDHLANANQLETLGSLVNSYLGIAPHPLVSGMLKTDVRSDRERIANLNEFLSMLNDLGYEKEVAYYLAQENANA